MGPRSERQWGPRNETFDLRGQHLQKHLGEGPSQVNIVLPGAIPPAAPQRPAPCTAIMSHPYDHTLEPAAEKGTWGASEHPSAAGVLASGHPVLSPLLQHQPENQRRSHCAAVRSHPRAVPAPSGHMHQGTAPTANGKVQGRGELRGEAHKGLFVQQVSLGCAHVGLAVQQQNAAQKYDKTPFSQAAVKL